MIFSKKVFCKTTLCTTAVLLTACSSKPYAPDPSDPLQGMNRATYSFNQKLDKYALKPAAQAYTFVTPQVARDRVTNFFSNIGEVPTFFNDTLQGNLKLSATALGRFAVNTTIGLLGLFDPASSMGLTKHYNDFGITLAQYGVTTSPYLVLPLIGPSSIRDALALWPNYEYMSLWGYAGEYAEWRNIFFVIDIVNLRASLLSSDDVVQQASLDQYAFIRNAYLQKRASLIKRYTGRDVGPTGQANTDEDPLNGDDLSQALEQQNGGAPPLNATKNNATSKNNTTNTTSAVTPENNSATPPPPVSFRQQSQDPVKQSLAQNELAEMGS
ncbi:MAG: vacJ like lipofamily protein [Gammaproteobacteria bacterium]|jgi:phospholipid-binding lipoprotein MlaA|nr:vacJ like lipofamily protein [Gammaproteobacteria bacterium]